MDKTNSKPVIKTILDAMDKSPKVSGINVVTERKDADVVTGGTLSISRDEAVALFEFSDMSPRTHDNYEVRKARERRQETCAEMLHNFAKQILFTPTKSIDDDSLRGLFGIELVKEEDE